MSKHWRPDEDVARARFGAGRRLRSLDEFILPEFVGRMQRAKRQRLPEGAKAGLILLAAACLGLGIGLYQAFGPRDVFENTPAIDWTAVDEAAKR